MISDKSFFNLYLFNQNPWKEVEHIPRYYIYNGHKF